MPNAIPPARSRAFIFTPLLSVAENLRAYFAYLGGTLSRPMIQRVDSRPFVHRNNLAFVAPGAIHYFGTESVRRVATNKTTEYWRSTGSAKTEETLNFGPPAR